MRKQRNNISRRRLLKDATILGAAGAMTSWTDIVQPTAPKPGIIEAENKKPGTIDWQITNIKTENDRSEMIEGYCSQTSIRAGEQLDIYLSAKPATNVTIDIYRLGYYGGKGGRHIQQFGPYAVKQQPVPPVIEYRLRECRWERTAQLTIPEDWISGVYLGKLSCSDHRFQSYIIFVVRDDRAADVMVQTSDTTWQAYNRWPDKFSAYDSDAPGQAHSARTWVSYDRPYGKFQHSDIVDQPLSQGSGEFLMWEYPLCYWLEQQGYDVTYCSNIDTHSDRQGLSRVKCFFSVGHDEYWTTDMYDNVKHAIDRGLNVGFLCGNSVFAAIELAARTKTDTSQLDKKTGLTTTGQRATLVLDPKGLPNRVFYRIGRFGGITKDEEASGMIGPFEVEPPSESLLVGARTMWPFNGAADWIVSKPDHWIFEGTGMNKGDRIRGLVGWEHHGNPGDIPGIEVIAEGVPITLWEWKSHYTATVYPGPRNNWVFNAATIFWSTGLSRPPGYLLPYSSYGRPHGPDERVQQITANFLKKGGARLPGRK